MLDPNPGTKARGTTQHLLTLPTYSLTSVLTSGEKRQRAKTQQSYLILSLQEHRRAVAVGGAALALVAAAFAAAAGAAVRLLVLALLGLFTP